MTQKEELETKKADNMHLQSLTNFGYSALGTLKSLLASHMSAGTQTLAD